MNQLIKDYLENISNILFFKKAYFGLAFLAIFVGFSPHLAISGIFASLVGYTFSVKNSTPKLLRDAGLLTLNGFFLGIAMASLFPDSPQFYFFLLIGALSVPLVTLATHEILQHWKLSPFIISYIIVVWVLFLSARAISMDLLLYPALDSSPFVDQLFNSPYLAVRFAAAVLTSMGYLFFLPNPIFGLCILALVSFFGPRQGFYFLLGTSVATFAAFLLSSQQLTIIDFDKYTYSAGLIGIGLAAWPEKFSYRTITLFCTISVIVTLALVHLLSKFDLPALSLPYVLTIWLALLSRTPRYNIKWAD